MHFFLFFNLYSFQTCLRYFSRFKRLEPVIVSMDNLSHQNQFYQMYKSVISGISDIQYNVY